MKSIVRAILPALATLLVGVGIGYAVWGLDDSSPSREGASPTGETGGSSPVPPSMEACNHDDTSGCTPGAELVLTNDQWRCREPLADVAEQLGGTLPLKITAEFTTFVETSGPVIDLREGCTGDGTDAIDLILDIQGDGRTRGGTNDALSVKIDAHDIDITGNIDCGPRMPGAHQDGVQAQGARDIAFVDLEIGDWEDERATCTGAEGGIGISLGGVVDIVPTDHKCIRCRVIACRRGINIAQSVGAQVTDSRFRSGNPAEREERLATGEIGLCNFAVDTCMIGPTARDYVFERNVCDEFPYEESANRR